jgi:hypothetical protein
MKKEKKSDERDGFSGEEAEGARRATGGSSPKAWRGAGRCGAGAWPESGRRACACCGANRSRCCRGRWESRATGWNRGGGRPRRALTRRCGNGEATRSGRNWTRRSNALASFRWKTSCCGRRIEPNSLWGRGGRDDEPRGLPDDGPPLRDQEVCAAWRMARSSFYWAGKKARREPSGFRPQERGPKIGLSDEALLRLIRSDLAQSPFQAKVTARCGPGRGYKDR